MEIDIDIDNNRLFATIAHVLDQNDVQDRIASIRKHWKINNYVSVDKFEDWINDFHEEIIFTPEAAEIYNSAVERLEIDIHHRNLTSLEELQMNQEIAGVRTIDYEIQYSLRKLRLPFSLRRLFLKAVLCNSVSENDLPKEKVENIDKKIEAKK